MVNRLFSGRILLRYLCLLFPRFFNLSKLGSYRFSWLSKTVADGRLRSGVRIGRMVSFFPPLRRVLLPFLSFLQYVMLYGCCIHSGQAKALHNTVYFGCILRPNHDVYHTVVGFLLLLYICPLIYGSQP